MSTPIVAQFLNVRDFGALADGVTDDSAAFQRAIEALDAARGGMIEVPFGTYRIASTVNVNRECVLRGSGGGGGSINAGTIIIADAGVTAFRFWAFGGPSGLGSSRSIIEHMCVGAAGRDTGTTTATFSGTPTSKLLANVTASVKKGETVVAITGSMSEFYVGMNITIPDVQDPYPHPTCIIGITGQNLQMYAAAKADVAGAAVTRIEQILELNPQAGDAPLSDWKDGQLISIPGVGEWVRLDGVTAATSQITNPSQIKITPPPDLPFPDPLPPDPPGPPGFIVGAYYVIGASFPTPTKCFAVNGPTVIMAADSQATETAAKVDFAMDGLTRIVRGGGTSSLVIDASDTPNAPATNVAIEHADAGVDMLSQCSVQNSVIGSNWVNPQGFQGPAIAIRGNHGNWVPTNANTWSVYNTRVYYCRNGLYVVGVDANVGMACGVHSAQSRQWSFVDLSQNSNNYVTCHTDGGFGWIAPDRAAGPTLFGCYTEEGTVCRIGSRGTSISAVLGAHLGDPAVWAGGQWRRLILGGPAPGDPLIDLFPSTRNGPASFGVYYWTSAGLWPPITHRRAGLSEVATKWQVWACDAGFREHAYAIADGDADDKTANGFIRASMWLPRGVMIGDRDGYHYLDPNYASVFRLEARYGVPTDDPYVGKKDGWHVADLVHDATLTDTYPFRMCIQAGHAGSGALFTPVCGIGGYSVLTISGNANIDTSANVQAYFTESIEVQSSAALASPATLTFAAAKCRRWIYNNTTGGQSLNLTTGSGNTISIANGMAAWVACDGTGMKRQSADSVTT